MYGLAGEFDRLGVIAEIEMPDGENVEVLACVRREGTQTKRPFDLSNSLVATAGVDQDPPKDRIGVREARIECDRSPRRIDCGLWLATESQGPSQRQLR